MKCVILCVFTLLGAAYTQKSVDDACTIKKSQTPGSCTLLKHCDQALASLKKGLFPETCSFQGTEPIVCCPKIVKPDTNLGRISKIKCKEYSSFAYDKVTPILTDGQTSAIKEKCPHEKIPLINDGNDAFLEQYPHMVIIGHNSNSSDLVWISGGALISEQHVLTSALFVTSPYFGPPTHVLLGTIDPQEADKGQIIKIVESVVHPGPSHHNLAILKLEKKAEMSTRARPACLESDPEKVPAKAAVTNWDDVGWRNLPQLRLKNIILNTFNCSVEGLTDTELCAADSFRGKQDCLSLVGGILQNFHSDDIPCMYDIIGVTTSSAACFGGPAPYVKVANYIKWIEDTVWAQSS